MARRFLTPRLLTVALLTFGAALLSTGCAHPNKSARSGPAREDKVTLSPTEYETVYVTGSMIPVRVPKSPTARPLPPASPVNTISPEAFERIVQRGQATSR